MFKRTTFLRVLAVVLLGVAGATPSAHAMSRDVRAVLVAGAYGLAGGTALGLVSFPATQSPRSIFIGTSVGLYLGLAAGIVYVLQRQETPGAVAELDFQRGQKQLRRPMDFHEAPLTEISFSVYRF